MSVAVHTNAQILQQHPVNAGVVLGEGLLAGAMAALVIGFCQLLIDLAAGEFLRTPSVLYGLFLDANAAAGAMSVGGQALRFTVAHVAAWLVVGLAASLLVSLSDAFPRLWYIACGGTAFVFLSLLYGSIFLEAPGLPRFHVTLGVLAGPAVIFGWLARRHPGVLKQFDRTALTEVGAHDLSDALLEEYRTQQQYERALALSPRDAVLLDAIAAKQVHIDRLLDLFERMDAIPPEPPATITGGPAASLEGVYRSAIERERNMVEMYDRFLAAVDELKIRDVFVHLRESAVDELLPRFEQALEHVRH